MPYDWFFICLTGPDIVLILVDREKKSLSNCVLGLKKKEAYKRTEANKKKIEGAIIVQYLYSCLGSKERQIPLNIFSYISLHLSFY